MREKMLDGVFPLRNKEKIVVYHEIGGRKQMEGTMKNGKNEGLWTWWDEDGNITKTERYKDGELVK